MSLISQRFGRSERLQSAARNSPPLQNGSSGDAVKTLQASLVELGFPMPISTKLGNITGDGIYGAETTKAVRAFQLQQGLSADGIAGKDTLHRIDQIYVGRESLEDARERILNQTAFVWT